MLSTTAQLSIEDQNSYSNTMKCVY